MFSCFMLFLLSPKILDCPTNLDLLFCIKWIEKFGILRLHKTPESGLLKPLVFINTLLNLLGLGSSIGEQGKVFTGARVNLDDVQQSSI